MHRRGRRPWATRALDRDRKGERDLMHYEIEQAGPGHEHGPEVGSHAEPDRWHVVDVFDADAVQMPLRFDTLGQARTYVARTPGTLRIMEVTDEGERLPVAAGAARG